MVVRRDENLEGDREEMPNADHLTSQDWPALEVGTKIVSAGAPLGAFYVPLRGVDRPYYWSIH